MAKNFKIQTACEDADSDVEIVSENQMDLDDGDHHCFLCIEGERLLKKMCCYANELSEQSNYEHKLCSSDIMKSDLNTNIRGHSSSVLNESNVSNEEVSVVNEETLKKLITCKVCCKKFACKRNLKRHIKESHSSIIYSCDVCKTSFSDVSKFRLHCSEHVDSDNGLFLCSVCGKKFLWKSLFKQHTCVNT